MGGSEYYPEGEQGVMYFKKPGVGQEWKKLSDIAAKVSQYQLDLILHVHDLILHVHAPLCVQLDCMSTRCTLYVHVYAVYVHVCMVYMSTRCTLYVHVHVVYVHVCMVYLYMSLCALAGHLRFSRLRISQVSTATLEQDLQGMYM